MRIREVTRDVVERWSVGWRDALASSVAAGLSWLLAHQLLGHPQPLFAAVAAIVCLSPGLPSRGRQAVNMMLGVVTGILVGELLLVLPVVNFALRLAVITFVAMMAALSFGLAPVIAIQSGVSAILVIAMGPVTAGPTRLMDVAVGAGVGLLFSQVLMTPDPVRLIENAARRMLKLMALGFAQDAEAVAERDQRKAQAALRHFFEARDSLNALGADIASARSHTRWSLRGRIVAREVAEAAARYDRRAIRLYASTLLFAEALANALRRGEAPPPGLKERVDRVARICERLAEGSTGSSDLARPTAHEPGSAGWRTCLEHLRAVEEALQVLEQTSGASETKAAASPSRT